MPRQTTGNTPAVKHHARAAKRKSGSSRTLNAFAIAQQEIPVKTGVRRSRLGEIEDADDEVRRGNQYTDGERPAKRSRGLDHRAPSDDESAGHDSRGTEWHIGVEGDDEDSELDSDEAMGPSDEERYEGMVFRGSSSRSLQRSRRAKEPGKKKDLPELDLQEDIELDPQSEDASTETDEDEADDTAVDLALVLDQQQEKERIAQSQNTGSRLKGQIRPRTTRDEADAFSDNEDASGSSEDHSALSMSDDEDIVANNDRLKSFVHGLERREASGSSSMTAKPPLALGDPSDHGLTPTQKLTIADLLPTVTDPRLRESLKMLHNSEMKGSRSSNGPVLGKLDPPLPKRQQDKLDRAAAYAKSKETLGRWVDTVKQNRRAEHISFPLPDPAAIAAAGPNQLRPISESKCPTSLESTIQSILQESGLISENGASAERSIEDFEMLQQKKISLEEAQSRRAELRKARELMFREEIRARRIKKIKSKAYRRVHRKEREKNSLEERGALAAVGALDSDAEREKQDRRRAEERMGRRHKESRWAKSVKATGRAAWDEDTRSGVNEMVLRDEALRKRIEARDTNDSDRSDAQASDVESSDDISIDGYDEAKSQKLKKQLQELESAEVTGTSQSRLSAMPFMRKAETKRLAENQAEMEQTRRLLSRADGDAVDPEDDLEEPQGRRTFGLGRQDQVEDVSESEKVGEFEERISDNGRDVGSQFSHSVARNQQIRPHNKIVDVQRGGKGRGGHDRNNDAPADLSNPWLSVPRDHKSQRITDEPTLQPIVLAQKVKNRGSSRTTVPADSIGEKSTGANMEDWTSPSESEPETPQKESGRGNRMGRNEELVRMAFAGDDVFEAFTDEKKATMDEEGDQVVDDSLPGWGSWTGAGISKGERRYAKSRKSTTVVKGVNAQSRKDVKLERVIINEKRSKKNARYLAPELPHPFESRQQYERSLRQPLGPEWSTKLTFQDATKPRVLIKQGVIRPMEKPMV